MPRRSSPLSLPRRAASRFPPASSGRTNHPSTPRLFPSLPSWLTPSPSLCATSSFREFLRVKWPLHRRCAMQPASATDFHPAISLLEQPPHLLETLLGDLSGELRHWKPPVDRWSISEGLAHLAALEQVYAERAW